MIPTIKLEIKNKIRVRTLIFFIKKGTNDFQSKNNNYEKKNRPFIGVLFMVNSYEYFAPLSCPKIKHKSMKNTLDFVKIKNGEYGGINFNNMIPVDKKNYKLVDLNNQEEKNYNELLRHQLDWINANKNMIIDRALKLYFLYIEKRCCNFSLLEEKSKNYNKNNL